MKNFQKWNIVIGWIVFGVASLVYIMTSEPTASFWDCGEYIATAHKLQVGHPPGAPFFQLMGRFFALFAGNDTSMVARMINTMSALSSSFTILFLFWTITHLARRFMNVDKDSAGSRMWAVLGAGIIGSLAYTFSDSFWFSAVEGEVYAMSSFFTAVVFWAILRWEDVSDQPGSYRWIYLIAFLVGLSVGVHLLNLLAIPAMALVIYFKKYPFTIKGLIISAVTGVAVLALVMYGIVPWFVKLAGLFERWFVNGFHLPFNTGTLIYFVLVIALLVYGVLYARAKGKALLHTIVMSVIFILIGYSSFFMLVIRSNANPPIDENNPEDAVSLLAYLNREQYGDWPLWYGQYYNAPVAYERGVPQYEDGNPVYGKSYQVLEYEEVGSYASKSQANNATRHRSGDITIKKNGDEYIAVRERLVRSFEKRKELNRFLSENPGDYKVNQRYIIVDARKRRIPVYDDAFTTIFPRMWSNQRSVHPSAYRQWAHKSRKNAQRVQVGGGQTETRYVPTFGENLKFFFDYQVGHMYLRYFMWNFAGRQNDIQGHGNAIHGNWISGIEALDKARLGPQDTLPSWLKNSEARNKFYLLPLILGLFGLFVQAQKDYKGSFIVGILFIMTGLAIVVYLNQYPYQPRERDYAYAASFYAFAIWIGLGVYGIFDFLKRIIPGKIAAIAATLSCAIVPGIMGAQGWDDHDRSGRYTALQVARSYLDSCDPNAILFTNGDNDTFPLWYAQEVEGYRTDVRVVNLSLLNTDWYIDQMIRKAYDSEPVPFTMTRDQYRSGTRDQVYLLNNPQIVDTTAFHDLGELIQWVKSDNQTTRIQGFDYFPTKRFSLPVDKQKVLEYGVVPPELDSLIVDRVRWTLNESVISKSHLMVLDLLAANNWERPIYFAITTGNDSYIGLTKYFQLEGMAYHLVPIRTTNMDGQIGRVDTEILYDRIMNTFGWGGMNDPDIYLDETNRRMVMNFRNIFGRLAIALAEEGDTERSIEVSKRCLEVMPHEVVPHDYFSTFVADGLVRAGDIETADSLLTIIYDRFDEELYYYFSFDVDELFSDKFQTIAFQQHVIQVYLRVLDKYFANGNTERALELSDKIQSTLVWIGDRTIRELAMVSTNRSLTQAKLQDVRLMQGLGGLLSRYGHNEKAQEVNETAATYEKIIYGNN